MYLGSWKIDDLVTLTVQTHTPSTGADVDADGNPTYRIYEDETGTPILTGSFAKLDDANTLGFYSEQITLSAANGFEKGKSYNIRKSATVAGVAGSEVDFLQIEAEVDANIVSDKTGYALSASQTFNLIGSITGNLSGSVGSVVGAVGSVTGDIGGLSAGAQADVRDAIGLASANLDTQLADLPTVAEFEARTLVAAAYFDPAADSVIVGTNNDKTGYSIASGGIGSGAIAVAERNNLADAYLDRNMATGTDSGTDSTRTVRQALRVLRNKVSIPDGEVYKEDDTTVSFSFAITTAAGDPITIFDPAS